MSIDHDSNFKKLLTTFFVEFVDLFYPHIRECIIPESLEFLPQELFLDPVIDNPLEQKEGRKRSVDLAAKFKVEPESALHNQGGDIFLILHVDAQSTSQPTFNRRMFRYFSRLHDRYNLPVYPIALLTFDEPLKEQVDHYTINVSGKVVLDFRYEVIQLNRLRWRDYVNNVNPVSCALMTKMQIAPRDRPRVKFESLRLLASLKLDETRWKLISGFVDEYLRLDLPEQQQFQSYLARLQPEEREDLTMITTSWKEEGRVEGRLEGRVEGQVEGRAEGRREEALEVVESFLARQLGSLSTDQLMPVQQLSLSQLKQLREDLFEFSTPEDLAQWLQQNP